jgi:hypothetical protein
VASLWLPSFAFRFRPHPFFKPQAQFQHRLPLFYRFSLMSSQQRAKRQAQAPPHSRQHDDAAHLLKSDFWSSWAAISDQRSA